MKPLFIVGCPRSGTTLFLTLLSDHPQLFVFPMELRYFKSILWDESVAFEEKVRFLADSMLPRLRKTLGFRNLDKMLENIPQMRNLPHRYEAACLRYKQQGLPLYQIFVQAFMDAWRGESAGSEAKANASLRYWVEKTPGNEFHVDTLVRDFPTAKFLHVVRDPRAYYLSRKIRHRKKGKGTTLQELTQDWRRSVEQGFRNRSRYGPAMYQFVRYEEIITDPEKTMRSVCDSLGIGYSSSLTNPTLIGFQIRSNSSFRNRRPRIVRNAAVRWQACLSPYELFYIEKTCYDAMRRFGYQPLTSSFTAVDTVRNFMKSLFGDRYFYRYYLASLIPSAKMRNLILPRKRDLLRYYEEKLDDAVTS